jgi:hypothetical protein
MTRAEERAFRLLEESAREIARVFGRCRPYTLEERALKRLTDTLDTLDRSREMDAEHAPEDPS